MSLLDPTEAPIEQKKMFGLWPPSKDNIADSMYPYIKRMKKDKVNLLMVGDNPGLENALRFEEIDTEHKIASIEVVGDEVAVYDDVRCRENLVHIPNAVTVVSEPSKEAYDLVYIFSGLENLSDMMQKYYSFVEKDGIFCGDQHHTIQVKDALVKFRKSNKITNPIFVSNRLCWAWKNGR